MAYAGQDYGSNGAWSGGGNGGAAGTPVVTSFTAAHASAVVVLGALLALILIRAGFRGVNVGGASLKVG